MSNMLTMPTPEHMNGVLAAIRCNVGQKSAIVWRFMDREVWIDEVPAIGAKRAMFEFHKTGYYKPEAIRRVLKCEADADHAVAMLTEQERLAQERYDAHNASLALDEDALMRAAEELGIDLSDVGDDHEYDAPVVIESDPYKALGV